MTMLARSNNFRPFAIAAAAIMLVSGCGSQVKVPEEAQLIWYGKPPVNFDGIPTIKSAGQLYLYDDSRGKVVSVVPVSEQSRFKFGELDADHDYAMYFVPMQAAPSLTAQPTTHPAH